MKCRFFLLILLLCSPFLNGQDYNRFKMPKTEDRPKPLWFWNNDTITKEQISIQMKNLIDKCGYGGLSILPFGKDFKPIYLSDEYFEIYRYTADLAT